MGFRPSYGNTSVSWNSIESFMLLSEPSDGGGGAEESEETDEEAGLLE